MQMYPVCLDHDSKHESTAGVAVQVEEKDRLRVYWGRDLKRGALHGIALDLGISAARVDKHHDHDHDQRKRRKTRLKGCS